MIKLKRKTMRIKIFILLIIIQLAAVVYLINIISDDDTPKKKSGINHFIEKNKNVN